MVDAIFTTEHETNLLNQFLFQEYIERGYKTYYVILWTDMNGVKMM